MAIPATREFYRLREVWAQVAGAAPVRGARVLHQPGHVLPVVRTGSEAHLDEMLAASELRLGDQELKWLDSG
jgi:aryl-alcohol dehydrogenase-like predicted oxidoreductase